MLNLPSIPNVKKRKLITVENIFLFTFTIKKGNSNGKIKFAKQTP